MTMQEAQQKLNAAKTKMDLYSLAGFLNNNKRHVHTDKVTYMGFCDFDECIAHVQQMINEIIEESAA